VFIYSAIVIHFLAKKTLRSFFVLTNILIQQVVCALLKRYFAQARPLGACSTTFGYPSGHSGFASALATWLILEVIMFHDKMPFKTSRFYSILRNCFVGFAPFIPVSRYFLNYHSWEQIAYGLLTGFLCTIFYFGIVTTVLVRNGNGRLYSTALVKVGSKFQFQENFKSHQQKESNIEKKVDDLNKHAMEHHGHHHPLRGMIKDLLRSDLRKIIRAQEKIGKEKERLVG